MLELGFKALGAYLLGSVIGSLLLGTLRGVDIRTQGSGNAGGTNALRTQGWAFALGVIVVDVGKALLAVGWLPGVELPGIGVEPDVDRAWLTVVCAAAVVLQRQIIVPDISKDALWEYRREAAARAGLKALVTNVTGSSENSTMSIFSPRSSRMIACTRVPFMPTHAPTGSTSRSRE